MSVVIPVWNGGPVIESCLRAVLASAGGELAEVICVDNASADDSADRIVAGFPDVALLRQPANLGFAGGVNAGIAAARGDTFVLLNQDCLPEPGWLRAVQAAIATNVNAGIAGCTILNSDGTIDHAGARMTRPSAYGEHLTEVGDDGSRAVDYVTGAAFVIRRLAFEAIGAFDEGFYPAYYEEADYCYRARRRGFEVIYAPAARVQHLRSSGEAARSPIKHAANQHRQRFRFVIKHWDLALAQAFFAAERQAVAAEIALHQAIGRILAARKTCSDLGLILAARERDLDDPVTSSLRQVFETGFAALAPAAHERAKYLVQRLPRDVVRSAGVELPPDHPPTRLSAQLRARIGYLAVRAQNHEQRVRLTALHSALTHNDFPR